MNSAQSPHFVKAQTAAGLERAMLLNNTKYRTWFNYQIIWDGKSWFAWYHVDPAEKMSKDAAAPKEG